MSDYSKTSIPTCQKWKGLCYSEIINILFGNCTYDYYRRRELYSQLAFCHDVPLLLIEKILEYDIQNSYTATVKSAIVHNKSTPYYIKTYIKYKTYLSQTNIMPLYVFAD